MKETGLARSLVDLREKGGKDGAVEFIALAKPLAASTTTRDEVRRGLFTIAKAEQFEDIRTRNCAVSVLGILGFTRSREVRSELFELFTTTFDNEKLNEMAAIEAMPGTKCWGIHRAEMKLLTSLLRGMLRVKEAPGTIAAHQVLEAFRGTRFAMKLSNRLEE